MFFFSDNWKKDTRRFKHETILYNEAERHWLGTEVTWFTRCDVIRTRFLNLKYINKILKEFTNSRNQWLQK